MHARISATTRYSANTKERMRNSRKPTPTVFLSPNGRQMSLNAPKRRPRTGPFASSNDRRVSTVQPKATGRRADPECVAISARCLNSACVSRATLCIPGREFVRRSQRRDIGCFARWRMNSTGLPAAKYTVSDRVVGGTSATWTCTALDRRSQGGVAAMTPYDFVME